MKTAALLAGLLVSVPSVATDATSASQPDREALQLLRRVNTWQASVPVASVSEHGVNGNLRTSPLPSAEVSGDGTVYVAWQDCGFRSGCGANDIVYSTSTDGVAWTAKTRVPIDPTNSNVDHFIPGFAVDRATSGNSTRLALGYYYYPVSNCGGSCQLNVGFVSSTDNGATWTQPRHVAGRIRVPTLVVHDRADRINAFADGEAFAQSIQGAQLLATEGLGHRRVLKDAGVLARIASFAAHR